MFPNWADIAGFLLENSQPAPVSLFFLHGIEINLLQKPHAYPLIFLLFLGRGYCFLSYLAYGRECFLQLGSFSLVTNMSENPIMCEMVCRQHLPPPSFK